MLPVLLLLSLLHPGLAVDYGSDFVLAFPENIAYYFPGESKLLIRCTALHASTDVNITGVPYLQHLNAGQENVTEVTNMEETLLGISNKVIRITSTKDIVVTIVSKRGDSMQSNMVLPLTSLDSTYTIPFPNYTLLTSKLNTYQPSDWSSSALIFNFRLMIINAEGQSNTVTVPGQSGTAAGSPFTLEPYQMVQIQGTDPWTTVSGTGRVAVILTYPCVDTLGCRCNLILHQVRPDSASQGSEFVVPPFVAANLTRLFVTSQQSVDVQVGGTTHTVAPGSLELLDFLPDDTNALVKLSSPGSLRLVRPGLVMGLLPASRFSGCFLVSPTSLTRSQMVIVVPTNDTAGLRQNSGPLSPAPTWTVAGSTGFSWALVDLHASPGSSVVWHISAKIAVYLFEKSPSGITYGGPAISINDNPDPRGCMVKDDLFVLHNDTLSWQASRSLCITNSMILASPSFQITQNKMVGQLRRGPDAGDVWLGLRRNLMTSAWYWQDTSGLDFTNWADGHPDSLSNDFCVSMSSDQGFTWSSERCCATLRPLCATAPEILSSIDTISKVIYTSTQTSTPGLVPIHGTIE